MQKRKSAKVRLVVRTKLGAGLSAAELERRLERMTTALKLQGVELSVLLTGDAQMRQLNRLYRKKDRTTDVLAFAMNEGVGNPTSPVRAMPRLIGDVIVSIPTARRQANAARRAPVDEVTMLLAHGLLHLLGWDHATVKEEQAMVGETNRLCEAARGLRKGAASHAATRTQRREPVQRKLS